MDRRAFLAAAGALAIAPSQLFAKDVRCKAILFDGFPIFDPRPVFSAAERLFPGKGDALSALWKSRQFEYTWLRSLMGRYEEFPDVIRDALRFAARTLKLDLGKSQEDELVEAYFRLKAWPDVLPALEKFKAAGIRMGFLSNFSEKMLSENIANSHLEGYFDMLLSTDRVKAFKPDPRAYEMGEKELKLDRREIVFVAFAGWDVAGAKSFGYPTFWANRGHFPEEMLGLHADATGALSDLERFAGLAG